MVQNNLKYLDSTSKYLQCTWTRGDVHFYHDRPIPVENIVHELDPYKQVIHFISKKNAELKIKILILIPVSVHVCEAFLAMPTHKKPWGQG